MTKKIHGRKRSRAGLSKNRDEESARVSNQQEETAKSVLVTSDNPGVVPSMTTSAF
ncbi:MAG: hypothetical protein ACYDCM_02545 [Candidatus Acidiferrales bacterium]